MEKNKHILKVIAKAGVDYKVVAKGEVKDKERFYEELNSIKEAIKEWYEEWKKEVSQIKEKFPQDELIIKFFQFPCDVNELILELDEKEIGRISIS